MGSRRAEKEKMPCHQKGKEVKLNCYEIQETETKSLKEILKFLNERYVPLVELLLE
jgi:hypothetical protein